LVRSKTIALFKAGKISKAKAPGDAKIAANCLKLMQN
jgi:hypothetical protein